MRITTNRDHNLAGFVEKYFQQRKRKDFIYQEGKYMPVVENLLQSQQDGSINFGNHQLEKKTKLEDFEHEGDLYKVKTYQEITKLERNGMFVYESVPGTSVENFKVSHDGVEFFVEGAKDAQITLQLENDTTYEVIVGDTMTGQMRTHMSGKLNFSVELNEGVRTSIRIIKKLK